MYAALLFSLCALLAVDARTDWMLATHTRAMSPAARDLLHLALSRSTIVRGLVNELERSDVIVLVMVSNELVTASRRPHMRFLGPAADARYVVVQMYSVSEPPVMQIPMLAHELRHALELAGAPEVRDGESFVRLFATIGWRVGRHKFETNAARLTEALVRQELARPWNGEAAAAKPQVHAGGRSLP